MTLPVARWVVPNDPDPARVSDLAHALKLPTTLTRLLVQRGYGSAESAQTFLRPTLDALSDPFDLTDMERAVEVIGSAVRAGTTILVHGDYDVDGQCATALLTRALREAGAHVVPFIPNRLRDGYDLGPAGVSAARAAGAGLIVTCDCGTTARDAVRQADAAGIQVVVTDHHLPGELPPAAAIVNPRRDAEDAPTAGLCGAGVAFKLVQALAPALGLAEFLPLHLIDLVALATVADVVPLTGENRILVRFGLKQLADSRWPGVRALIASSGLADRAIRAGHVGFVIGPRLNAAGRIGDAMDGLALLLSDDYDDALERARRLESQNARRQEIDQRILDEALEMVEQSVDLSEQYGLVLAREGWHAGVIGIAASRLVERFARPAILIALEGDVGKGSGRSIARFDLHAALETCAPHLARFGGHRMAAGLTIARDRVEAFSEAFNAAAHAALSPEDLIPTQRVDAVVTLEAMDADLWRLLHYLEPCGAGNPAPVFGVTGTVARTHRTVGSNHLRLTLDDGTAQLGAIGFDWADRVAPSWWDGKLDVAFRLDRDEWRGVPRLQARIVQLRPAS